MISNVQRHLANELTAALTAKAKREEKCNDKKHRPVIRESDWPIVTRGKAAARIGRRSQRINAACIGNQFRKSGGIPLANLPAGHS
jgi:hypothetical protein